MSIHPAGHVLRLERTHSVVSLFQQLFRLLEEDCSRTSLIAASLTLGHLFGTLILSTRASGARGTDIDERLDGSIELMRESINASLSVAELAASASLSHSHYATLFKRKTGYAVKDYFLRLKMQEACRLLDATTLPVKEIAIQLGYDDDLYFSRCFRRVMQMSPKHYRRQT
jgi:AraC-like DNA-binding protein